MVPALAWVRFLAASARWTITCDQKHRILITATVTANTTAYTTETLPLRGIIRHILSVIYNENFVKTTTKLAAYSVTLVSF